MTNHNHHNIRHHSNFWFSFTLGTLFGAGGLFFIGTKQGRKLLQKIIDMSENLEGSVEEIITSFQENVHDQEKKIDDSLHSVLEKIRTTLPVKKEQDKPFAKT